MSSKQLVADFRKFVEIQKERQAATQELSQILGIDVSFSDEEVLQHAMEEYSNYISTEINKEVEMWMKSLFLKT